MNLKKIELTSSLTHFLGFLLSIAALVLMVVAAAKHRTVWHIVSFSIFGASLILLYSTSMVYHIIPIDKKVKKIFQKLDHSMIYVLIFGSYTPICLVCLRGAWGWSIFGVILFLATLGIVWKSIITKMEGLQGALSSVIYFLMGWLIIIRVVPVYRCLTHAGFMWFLAGGLFYSLGILFFVLDHFIKKKKLFSMHDIFHIFVLIASFCHFWTMFRYVL